MNADQETTPNASLAIAALIDIAFLLLIYFIVTSTLMPKEGDMSMALGGLNGKTLDVEPVPITINAEGSIFLHNMESPITTSELASQLKRYQTVAAATGSDPLALIKSNDEARHEHFIAVLNTVKAVGIQDIQIAP